MNPRDAGRRGPYGDDDHFGRGPADDERGPQQGGWGDGPRHQEQRHFGGGQQGGYGGRDQGGGQQGGYRDHDTGYRGGRYRPGPPDDAARSHYRGGPSPEYRHEGGREDAFSAPARSGHERGVQGGWQQGYDSPSGYTGAPRSRGGFDDRDEHQPSWTDGHYGADPREQQHFDPEYQQWRAEQLRTLDNDYRTWRGERYKKFSDEFNTWRSGRATQAGTGGASATSGSQGQNQNQNQNQNQSQGSGLGSTATPSGNDLPGYGSAKTK